MKLNIFVLLLVVSGCSHAVLMKCPEPAPGNVFRCEQKIDGDFRMCKPPGDDYVCSLPQ